MIRTRVGYAGGEKVNPTYYSLGNHSETIQIDFDPNMITYAELLEIFWNSHSPTYPAISTQYKSIIFYTDESQKKIAEDSLQKQQEMNSGRIVTEIQALDTFYLAEDYHQKYYLRQYRQILMEYQNYYPDWQDFTNSAAVTKANGFAGGFANPQRLDEIAADLGLSDTALKRLYEILRRYY